MKKHAAILSAAFIAGNVASASLAQEIEVTEHDNITCVNDGEGAFSFYMEGYTEPMISILRSHWNSDGNNAVLSHVRLRSSLLTNSDVIISPAFESFFENFAGRFLMFYNPESAQLCSMEEWFFLNDEARLAGEKPLTVRRNFVRRIDASPAAP